MSKLVVKLKLGKRLGFLPMINVCKLNVCNVKFGSCDLRTCFRLAFAGVTSSDRLVVISFNCEVNLNCNVLLAKPVR